MNRSQEIYLVVDTVADPAVFAIYRDSTPLLWHQIWIGRKVLAEMGDFFRRALGDSLGLASEITRICVAVGPGGFSGSRIGVAGAKSLAFSLGVKVSIFDHQEALGYAARAELGSCDGRPLAVISDARRGQCHLYLAGSLGNFSETMENAECDRRIAELGRCALVGDAASAAAGRLGEAVAVELGPVSLSTLSPAGLGAYLSELFDATEALSPELVEVRYSREYLARANFDTARS